MTTGPRYGGGIRRRRIGLALLAAGLIAIAAFIGWLAPRNIEPARPLGSPGRSGTTGTGGTFTEQQGQEEIRAPEARGGTELLGQTVTLRARAGDVINDVAFWVEDGGRRFLVVVERDRRTGAERQRGRPSPNEIGEVRADQPVLITGKVERLPRAEQMYSWQLTDADRTAVAAEGVYVRAERVAVE